MSRVGRRAGTKALVCMECVKQTRNKTGVTPRNIGSFRGKTRERLNRHIREVHVNPRTIRPKLEDGAS
jgi:hypothetical protein